MVQRRRRRRATSTAGSTSGRAARGQFHDDYTGGATCGLDTNQCTIQYYPGNSADASRTDTISAAYVEDFDGVHSLSSSSGNGNGTVTVVGRTTTTSLACPDAPVGSLTYCTATVRDTDSGLTSWPFGFVYFTGDAGGFDNAGSCQPVDQGGGVGICSVGYHVGNIGANHLSASYASTDTHANSTSPTTTVTGLKHTSATAIDCPTGTAGVATTCTVTVTDTTATRS